MIIWNRILAVVDHDDASLEAMRYLAGVLGGSDACQVRLLGVMLPTLADAEPDAARRAEMDQEERQDLGSQLARAQEILVQAGLPFANLTIQVEEAAGRTVGESILAVQAQGGYGTVVVGRRHQSKAEEFLFGSVSSDIVHAANNFSVWVVA